RRFLSDLTGAAGRFHAFAILGHLSDRHARVVGNDDGPDTLPGLVEGAYEFALLRSIHLILTPAGGWAITVPTRRLHLPADATALQEPVLPPVPHPTRPPHTIHPAH